MGPDKRCGIMMNTKYEPVFFDIETTGLNPMAQDWWYNTDYAAQVVCVGVGTLKNWRGNPEDAEMDVRVLGGRSEYPLLKRLKNYMSAEISAIEGWEDGEFRDIAPKMGDWDTEAFLVGWNSRGFDFPYLGARFARLRLDGWPFIHERKRLDMMKTDGIFLPEDARSDGKPGVKSYPSQDEYAEYLGIELGEDSIDGSDVPKKFHDGRLDLVKRHCYTDIEDMMEIFLKKRDVCMQGLYDHYDIMQDAVFTEEI